MAIFLSANKPTVGEIETSLIAGFSPALAVGLLMGVML